MIEAVCRFKRNVIERSVRTHAMTIKRLPFEPVLLKHLDACGIDYREVVSSPDFRTLDRQGRLYRLAEYGFAATGDPLLGLKISRKTPFNLYGPVSLAFLSASSLMQVFQIAVKHHRIFQSYPAHAISLHKRGDRVYLTYDHPIWLEKFPNFVPDLFFSYVIQMSRHLTGENLDAEFKLELTYRVPDRFQYQGELGLEVQFGSPHNRISAPLRVMQRRLPGASFLGHAGAYASLADTLLTNLGEDGGLKGRVEALLWRDNKRWSSAAEVARALNLSERSLRRQLHDEGSTFKQIRESLRLRQAGIYLFEMPVSDVAYLLGYRDLSTFRRAFRRWSGMTPTDYIRKNKAPQQVQPADAPATPGRNDP
ncbi:MAG TPA: AraC family transcriptional regulator ligand-binding domain-containing protein [Parvibaculum sp.]